MVKRDLDLFFQSALKLKSVKRAGWVSKLKVHSAESVADHTFSMCAIAMLFSDILGHDTERAMKMVILHDLAESVVGDYVPGDLPTEDKIRKESKAMHGILLGLPVAARSAYMEIWNEYVANRTHLARFIHRLDKLEMAMQAKQYSFSGYDEAMLEPFFLSAKAAIGNEDDIVSETLARYLPSRSRLKKRKGSLHGGDEESRRK
jgi:putative hydrolase of HD superfamily